VPALLLFASPGIRFFTARDVQELHRWRWRERVSKMHVACLHIVRYFPSFTQIFRNQINSTVSDNMAIAARLAQLGITLPTPPVPAANYIPFVVTGTLVHVAGQISKAGDNLIVGKLGEGLTVEDGQHAASVCIINLLAQVKAAAGGDLSRIKRFVKLNVFVNSSATFVQQPAVANGASDLLVSIFGESGKHARSAVGVAQLPFGVAVEIDGIVELIPETATSE
jgi:enamine deaminase RidA (YjgF/YER057c/UK114 family)